MHMPGLGEATKNRIAALLDSTCFKQRGFTVQYDDETNPVAIIIFSATPEYRFVLHSTGKAFATSECPGLNSDEPETFQRSTVELCLNAIQKWVERVYDRWGDAVLDEYGGVGDRDPWNPYGNH